MMSFKDEEQSNNFSFELYVALLQNRLKSLKDNMSDCPNRVESQNFLKVGCSQKNIGDIFIAKQICCFTILNFII